MNRTVPSASEPASWRRGGFTLIQCLGVLAILALLASLALPVVIKRLDLAAASREEADLNAIGESVLHSVLRTKTVTSYAGLASTVATEMAYPLSRITTTSRGYARAFVIDRNFNVGGGLPYLQTTNGTARPANARIAIVSSQSRALPIASTNGLSDSEFQAIWDTPDKGTPASSTWTGWGPQDDLHIKRLNLEPLFYQLILIDHDTAGGALFSIDGTSTMTVPTNGFGWSSYYLDGTVLGLHSSNGVVQTKYVMKRSISFVLEYGMWHGEITAGLNANTNSAAFATEAAEFFNSAWNTSAQQGATQLGVLSAMYTFMLDYSLWATECPHFSHRSTTLSQIPEYEMLQAVGKNDNSGFLFQFSSDLLK